MTQEPTQPLFTDGILRTPDVIQALHEIPSRCAEALVTAAAPNPGARAGKGKRTTPSEHPAPANLDVIAALAPDPDGTRRNVVGEIASAVRAVWEDHPHTPLPETVTLTADCRWLITHAALWQPDPFLNDFVTDAATSAHRMLSDILRERRQPRCHCPKCDGHMLLAWDTTILECGDCQHQEPTDLESRYRRRAPMTTTELCTEFAHLGVTQTRIWQWASRRKLTKAGSLSKEHTYWPWDVLCLAIPGLTDQAG